MFQRRRLKQRRIAVVERGPPDAGVKTAISNTSVCTLPTELLLVILKMSSPTAVTNVMRTNKVMHAVASRAIYTSVDVSDTEARMFLTTIASRTKLSSFYAQFVKRLTFSATIYFDKFITFPIFCETLLCLRGLRSLSILISQGDGDFMGRCLQRFAIIRECVSSLTAAKMEGERALSVMLTIPTLHTLHFGGDIDLADVMSYRHLSEVSITTPISYDEVDRFLNKVSYSPSLRLALKTLSVRLWPEVKLEPVLWAISDSLPELRTLSIQQPVLNALNVVRLVMSYNAMLPRMRSFLLNRFAVHTPLEYLETMKEDEFRAAVLRALEDATDSALSLSFICLGSMRWTRYFDERSWSPVMDQKTLQWWNDGLGQICREELERDIRTIRSGLSAPVPDEWCWT